jgi:hypothetical protein
VETIYYPEQAPSVIHQVIAVAYAGRGVAHGTLAPCYEIERTSTRIALSQLLRFRRQFMH